MQKRLVYGGTGVLYAKPSCKRAHFCQKRTQFVNFLKFIFYSQWAEFQQHCTDSLGLPSSVSSCGDRAQPAKNLPCFSLFFKTQLLNHWDFLKTFWDYYLLLIPVPLRSIWTMLPSAFLFLSGTEKPVFCLCPEAAAAIGDEKEPGLQGNNEWPFRWEGQFISLGWGQDTIRSHELRMSW